MNISTFIISLGLIIIVFRIIKSLRKGKSCGGNCGACGSATLCHNIQDMFEDYKKGKVIK